jgi:predicted ATPase
MVEKFAVLGLWGERNYRIEFVNGSLILVGENGTGKTTVLRLLYYVLSKKWALLADEDFEAIELTSGEEVLHIDIGDLCQLEECLIDIENDLERVAPRRVREIIMRYCGEQASPDQVIRALEVYSVPEVFSKGIKLVVERKMDNLPEIIKRASDWIDKYNPFPVIYLPTYRRSEKSSALDNNLDSHIRRHRGFDTIVSDIEVVKEGMRDVDEAIKEKIKEIRKEYEKTSSELNIRCFAGILNREYESPVEIDMEYRDPDAVSIFFSSMSNSDVFADNEKLKEQLPLLLSKTEPYNDYEKIVVYYYEKLIERYRYLKELEEPLEAFFHACNKYLTNKRLEYRPAEFKYEVVLERLSDKARETIDLNHLSSGEKQIISLLCYVYLAAATDCMVIIDEPELSLSVEWQMNILEDLFGSERCGALVVATQSPFVYDNSLKEMARSLDSFLRME